MTKCVSPSRHDCIAACRPVLLALALLLAPAAAPAYETERVVVVVIDGLRYTEGLGDPDHEFVPHMAALAEQGAIVDNFRNDGFTYTSRAIPAIWCGAWTEVHTFSDPDCGGTANNYSELPTVFEYYRKQLARPASDCVYSLKSLCSWKASFDVDYGPDYWPLYHTAGATDLDVWQETAQIIAAGSPRFLLMYLADVDHAGHSGVWSEYTQAIVTADGIVGALWDVLQADPAYAGKTTMLVTNDHGRHDWDFSGHGDGCEGCRRIQLLAIGPDVRVGSVSDIQRAIPDIAPTIGELLGFTTEAATGTAMVELLQPAVAVDALPRPRLPGVAARPSPAHPATVFSFALSAAGDVDLRLYDLAGRQLWAAPRRRSEAGLVRVHWDGRASDGRALPSGLYLVRVKTASGVQLGRVVLIR